MSASTAGPGRKDFEMRLLVVNGNTTQAITDRAVAVARRIAPPDCEIVGVTAPFGPEVVTQAPENLVAGHAILDALARHHHGFDAAILAISFDTALAEARALLPIPVYGITESALSAATDAADGIGLVTLGAASLPLYRQVFARHSAAAAIRDVAVVEPGSIQAYAAGEGLDHAILAEVERMRRDHAIGAAVICGAAVAGAAERLQPRTACPLFDGLVAAVRRALRRDPTAGAPAAERKRLAGVSGPLAALFDRPG